MAAEWQEKLDAAESLTERLRVALECSEKIVPLMDEDAITFPARTLSSEEILLASGAGDDDDDAPLALDDPPPMPPPPFLVPGGTAITVQGQS